MAEKTTKQLLYELRTDIVMLDGRLKIIEGFIREVVGALSQNVEAGKNKPEQPHLFKMEKRNS